MYWHVNWTTWKFDVIKVCHLQFFKFVNVCSELTQGQNFFLSSVNLTIKYIFFCQMSLFYTKFIFFSLNVAFLSNIKFFLLTSLFLSNINFQFFVNCQVFKLNFPKQIFLLTQCSEIRRRPEFDNVSRD